MATNIGPRIGITGEADYRKQISYIVNVTKNLQKEFQALNTAFKENDTSISKNRQQREKLKASLESANKALEQQKRLLNNASTEFGKLGPLTVENATRLERYSTNVHNTELEIEKLKGQLDNLPTSLEVVKQAIDNNNSAWKRNAEIMAGVGRTMTRYLTLPILAGLGASVKAAADWESGFTGVKKTVDEIVDENGNVVYSYEELDNSLREVASNSVIAYDELLAVGEIAGQLGISADKVAGFSEIMLKLGASTTMTSEEAATSIAKILNITNKGLPYSIETVEDFANVLVELGNNFATTEGDITLMATRLASAGTIAGLSTDEILALATSMSAVGIRAEAGGSAMAQTLVNLEKRVATFEKEGGDSLDKVAELAGTTAKDFAKAWKKEPAKAIAAFIKGLGTLDEEAESTTVILSELGMDGIRQANMIKALSLAYPQLEDALKKANDEWERGNALQEEYGKREETFNAKLQNFKNNLGLLAIEFGDTLLPTLTDLVVALKDIVVKFREMSPETKENIVKLGLFVAAIGPVLTTSSKLIIGLSNLKVAFSVLKGANGIGGAITALGNFGSTLLSSLGPLTLTLGALGLLGAGFNALFTANEEATREYNEQLGKNFVDANGYLIDFDATAGWTTEDWIKYNDQQQEAIKKTKDETVKWVSVMQDEMNAWNEESSQVMPQIAENYSGVTDGLADGVDEDIEKIKEDLRITFEEIGTSFSTWFEETKTSFSTWFEELSTSFTTWFDGLKTGVVTWFEETVNYFTTFFANLKTGMQQFGEQISSAWTSIWTGAKDKFNEIIEMISFALGVFALWVWGKAVEIKEWIVTKFTEMKESAIAIFNNLKEGISNVISNVYTTIVEGIGNAVDWIKGLAGEAWQWGVDMINGFIDGIKSAAGAISNAAEWVASKLRAFLHFSRPDVGPLRDYEEWMPHFMQGLANGIDSNIWRVDDALNNLTGQMYVNALPYRENTNSNAYNYGGIVINLNVPEGANGQQLVDEIEQEIVARTMRRKAVFGQ